MIKKLLIYLSLNLVICNCFPLNTLKSICSGNECNDYENILRNILNTNKEIPEITPCDICNKYGPVVRDLIRANNTDFFYGVALTTCYIFKIAELDVCAGAIHLFQNAVLNIINDTTLTNEELCSVALNCAPITNSILNWNITLPDVPKPPVIPIIPPSPSSPKVRILQLTDLHIDFEYQPGSLADCGQPLCCRNSSTKVGVELNENNTAGYWGDYRHCDSPLWTVENMFDFISKNEQFDLIYWTGDLPPHNVWNQTRSDQLNALEILTNLFLKYFPDKVIYPSLGNHEAAPVNMFPPPFVKEDNISWLYTALVRDWTKTGLPSYLSANISSGAFYSIQLYPGLRLISLNTNYCPALNFWLIINSTDPLGQLDWLAKTLQQSEDIGEKVHIIGHIPPAECLDSWSRNYYSIVDRYESTITAQIFGHTHKDEMRVNYDLNNITRATNIAYLGPSVTPESFLNPGYRIYTVDGNYKGSTWQILDYDTMFLNLTEANLYGTPKWRVEYSAKSAFNLDNFFPQDWSDVINKALNDLEGPIANKFLQYFSKSSDGYPACDKTCRERVLCKFKNARSDDFIPCSK